MYFYNMCWVCEREGCFIKVLKVGAHNLNLWDSSEVRKALYCTRCILLAASVCKILARVGLKLGALAAAIPPA
jgi:hypothetical protein